MTDQENAEWVTRKLKTAELQTTLVDNENTEPLDAGIPWVIELRIVGTPAVFQVRVQGELIIGRSDPRFDNKPDIDLEPYDGYQQGVSRRHAMIFPRNNRLVLTDLGSSNGTYVNGRGLMKGQEYRIRHSDTITIGKLQMQIFFAVMPSANAITAERTQPIRLQIPTLGSGQHILVVDHDTDVANVLGDVLTQAGFRVSIVSNFAEAVGFINRSMPDAILLELMLPDVNGLHLVKYIREKENGTNIPLLVVTSATGGFQMGQAIEAGVDVFMCKPVGIDELMRGVGKVAQQMHAS
jgi:CheY-like chemotaxis protein